MMTEPSTAELIERLKELAYPPKRSVAYTVTMTIRDAKAILAALERLEKLEGQP